MRQSEPVELCNEIWKASEPFLEIESIPDSLNYVMAMLFWRYVSDVWCERRAHWMKRFDGDLVMVERRLGRERILVPRGCRIASFGVQRAAPDIGERINAGLERLMEANPQKLRGVFERIDFNSERHLGRIEDRNARLRRALEGFCHEGLKFGSPEIGESKLIGLVVSRLLERFSSRDSRQKRAFYTPECVSLLMSRLLAPKKGDSIYDPVCGSGSLLKALGTEVGDRDFALFGQELNPMTHSLCRLNLLMQGVDSFRVELGDSLGSPQYLDGPTLMDFDVVVGNPPSSLKSWDRERASRDRFHRFDWGLPPKSKADFAFILHMIHCARKDGGRVGVLVSRGVLFRGGGEGKIRRRLVDENLVEAVVALPEKLFGRSSAAVMILILNRSKRSQNVLFVDASSAFVERRNRNEIDSVQIERIAAAYRNDGDVKGFSTRVSVQAIARHGYSLDLVNYFPPVAVEEPVDLASVSDEIQALEGELAEVRTRMSQCLEKLVI